MINIRNTKDPMDDKQSLFDSYNTFIMSDDRKVFFKLLARYNFFNMAKELNGDIVECGVFKGAGITAWLKMIDMYQTHSIKKVIGFDFFDSSFVDDINDAVDKIAMKQVFSRDIKLQISDISIEGITKKLTAASFDSSKYELVKGDISITSKNFIKDRPGFRISLLYLDLDLDKPTYDTLEAFWDRIVPGGVVVFDEYAYHSWSESNAVDRFISKKNIKLINTHLFSPTAYLIKE